jgi:hypothetical protein
MFVITADQVSSMSTPDAAARTLTELTDRWGGRLLLPPERSAGDEIQLVLEPPDAVTRIVLELTRTDRWSVGVGVGAVRLPLGSNARESTGAAFVAARRAVERAKKRQTRFALESEPPSALAADIEALFDPLLLLRQRRSEAGWQLHDLLVTGSTQVAAARELGITPQSASDRAIAAGLRADDTATAALTNMLSMLDTRTTEEGRRE